MTLRFIDTRIDIVGEKMPSFGSKRDKRNNASRSCVGQTLDSQVVGQSYYLTIYGSNDV